MGGSRGVHPLTGHSKLPQYLWTMAWEWVLTGFVYLGVRKRMKLRDLIGGRWAKPEDVLLDMMIAGGFWLAAIAVLGAGAKLMHLDQAGKFDSMRAATWVSDSRHDAGTAGVVLPQHHRRNLRGNHLPRIPAAPVRGVHQLDAGGSCCCRQWSSGRRTATRAVPACC